MFVAGVNYLVIEGVDIGIGLGGGLCAQSGLVEVKGTAGGLFAGSALDFNKASFEARPARRAQCTRRAAGRTSAARTISVLAR